MTHTGSLFGILWGKPFYRRLGLLLRGKSTCGLSGASRLEYAFS